MTSNSNQVEAPAEEAKAKKQVLFKIEDLALAYRKVKVDLFYGNHPRALKLVEFERNLADNLTKLRDKINGASMEWVTDEAFLGSWDVIPKSFDDTAWKQHKLDNYGTLIFSSPKDQWDFTYKETQKLSNEQDGVKLL